ncbi:MAG TPA: deoxyribose-phosphate aldolase [Phycisphaerae bacterium]|nr:deoxyribose-phosphate aldolase [Phycisphaerae bacterium]HRW51865.1 deoxyribose-phosphate aldolase [Phycisphaerae bacterium]
MTKSNEIPTDPKTIAGMIDHTLLKPDATRVDIKALCAEARIDAFASVCVNPIFVADAKAFLAGSDLDICTVIGFPLGANRTDIKEDEAARAIEDGATEIDMVMHIGALKGRDDLYVERDIAAVVEVCRNGGALCKVIFETCLLTDDEKLRACEAAIGAGADFVKTSTGFSKGGATVEDVALMYAAVNPAGLAVKASGGIRTLADFNAMVGAGATRIGASAGVTIVEEAAGKKKKSSSNDDY